MELHSIWNRIDQLEQLIVSQAKEIDTLRRSLNATQMNIRNCTQPEDVIHGRGRWLAASEQQQYPTACNRAQPSWNYSIDQRIDRMQPVGRNYALNHIHPVNAIPPFARPMVPMDDHHRYCHLKQRQERFGSERPSSRTPKLTTSNSNHNSWTLPANTRWSTGPSLLGTLMDIDEKGGANERSRTRGRDRYNLIELFTCFCPCFNMC